jgi:hypothetical protein
MTNTLFPGRPDYTGPLTGTFGLLHHEQLCENSRDVGERVDYVKRHKPVNEVDIRLHNMIYLGDCPAAAKRAPLYADYQAKLAPLDADYEAKRALLDADYQAKCALLYADYQAKCAPLDADYQAKCAPLDADYEAKRALLYADYQAKCAPLDADYQAKCAPLDADYEAKRAPLDAEILAYTKHHIPDCAWNGKTLVF